MWGGPTKDVYCSVNADRAKFFLEVVGTPNHYLAEMNLFNLFALTGGGEQKLKILLVLALLVLHGIAYIGKRRSGAFKQKKVDQNRTIIKEVIHKNVIFLLALALGSKM